ncbi:MAG: alpha/beta hydrolase [Actinomycetota bacterium]|nr:alpha/beta hydrolase [Actinomycetota bacterium]
MKLVTTDCVAHLDAGRVHYREHGSAAGRPVVFVHGFLVDHSLWSDVPERLAALGFRAIVPTWPLGAHRSPMAAEADLSPRGVGRLVGAFLAELGLHDVVLVGNDTGGAICQFLIDEDASRIGQLVLTDCDAFELFPPAPFDLLFRAGRHPSLLRAMLQPTRWGPVRNGPLGFGLLTKRRLRSEETRGWVTPYLSDAGVRRDTATLLRGWDPDDLADTATRLHRFERPVLLCWAPADRFFKIGLAHRLLEVFPDARLVEMPDARTFVALDQPARLAEEIAAFAGQPSGR